MQLLGWGGRASLWVKSLAKAGSSLRRPERRWDGLDFLGLCRRGHSEGRRSLAGAATECPVNSRQFAALRGGVVDGWVPTAYDEDLRNAS